MDKEDTIEVLDDHSSYEVAPSVTIVSEEQPGEIEETISVDSNGQVDPVSLDYNGYRNTLIQMYANSTEEDSIISTFRMEGTKCIHTLEVQFADGSEPHAQSKEFDCTENFKNDFLIPMVEDYNNHNQVFDSSVTPEDNGQWRFIARTSKNDSLSVSNISIEFANQLRDLLPKQEITVAPPKQLMKLNSRGISNYLVVILTVIAIGIALVGTIYFTIATR